MTERLYSVRMRASLYGLHISGAEQIVKASYVDRAVSGLINRALGHERGRPDSVTISAESLAGREMTMLGPLPVSDNEARSVADGHGLAVTALVKAGVSEDAAMAALKAVTSGASPSGGNMRGAMILDADTGRRLDPNPERGIRARSVDYEEGFQDELSGTLNKRGLDRTHLKEALALATKVAHAPGAVAEFCISDDPSYVTGYVASQKNGYVRITPIKNPGDPFGGRAFFVDGGAFDLDEYIAYLRETPVLITGAIEFE